MGNKLAELDASIQAKIDADADFQSSLDGLSDQEKQTKVQERKDVELDQEFTKLSDEATKNKELANNYKIRAEKAEGKGKPGEDTKVTDDPLTAKDAMLLAKADVALEDVDEVVEFARYRKLSILDAMKSPTLKAILAERVEERNTAIATQTGKGNRGIPKLSGDAVLERARKGQASEDDIDALASARMEKKLKR